MLVMMLFVVLVLIVHVHEGEGRHLKLDKTSTTRKSMNRSSDDHPSIQTSQEHDIDDFRPTAPGHSPGVGHSIHN